jgi:hypothetical protein
MAMWVMDRLPPKRTRAHGWEAKAHGLRIGRSMGAIIFEK